MLRFSNRLDWGAEPNAVSRRLLERGRPPEFDLTESNPTRAGFTFPDGILESFQDARSLRYDPDPRGLAEVREVTGADILTASSSESYAFLLKLLCDPGDSILVPRPSYPLFEFLARLDNVVVQQYPLFYDYGWHIDAGALRSGVTPRTRAIVVVHPNNPTGSYLKRTELETLEQIGLPVSSDEVFADYSLTQAEHPAARVSSVAAEARRITAFSLGGLSKSAGLPQMKLGWIRVGGAGRDEAVRGLELIADTYLSVSTPVQWAAADQSGLLRKGIRTGIQQRIAANLALLPEALHVEGGWYAIVRLPAVRSEEEWVLHLLDEHDVYVQPGYFFDFESGGPFAVVSLITAPAKLQEGLRRLRLAIASSHS